MRILVTGAAGRVGSTVAKGMLDRHEVRGHDRVEIPYLDDTIISELDDFAAVLEATRDIDAIAHIGGLPGGNEWEPMLQSNFIGTYNVFEAARQNGVKRIAYASRAGVHGPQPDEITRNVHMTLQPVGLYTVSKVFGEALGFSYVQQHGLEFVAVRIGNFNRTRDQPEHPHQLSHGDCVRVFERAVIHPGVEYEIVYGVSDNDMCLWDNRCAMHLGYRPQDNAERFRDTLEASQPVPDKHDLFVAVHGGGYAAAGHFDDP